MIVEAPLVPAIVEGNVWHSRETPMVHEFQHRAYQWLVDVDALGSLPRWWRPFAGFSASDHLDGSGIRDDLERFLRERDVALEADDRVLMLTNPRILGHTFNPLTVFWVLAPGGVVKAIVLEVHNTYGGRHAYLVNPDERGRARIAKNFYVSPFNDARGGYDVCVQLSVREVAVSVDLTRGGRRIMRAASRGVPRPATAGAVARSLLKNPLMTQRVSALIRLHGVWLWLRRLPIYPRTSKGAVT